MSSSPREIGTLIVVVLKANHLPNKRHIGKQDPYCLVVVNGEKKRTKAIKRGGQHPEWDEELRFTLFEDEDDLPARTAPGTPPPLPPKDSKGPKKIQGGNNMKIACYADDPREPDLIGDADVDLTEVLTKGETDEWFTLSNKDKFAGKVYLELTFWSNAPAPEKKVTPKPPKTNKQYAGPGSFVPSSDSPSNIGPPGSVYGHSRPPSDSVAVAVPSSLRASNSLAKLDLYIPPYEKPGAAVIDQVASEFGDMDISQHRRRESFPPVQHGYPPPGNPYLGDSVNICDHPLGFAPAHNPDPQYQYDTNQHPPAVRNSRFSSVPVSSSGFMPLSGNSTFPPPVHSTDALVYPPTISHTPAPAPYNPIVYHPPANYLPPPPQTPLPGPPNSVPYIPTTTPTPYVPQSFPTPQTNPYAPYPPPTPALPQQYSPAPQAQPQVHNGVTTYPAYPTAPSSSHETLTNTSSTSGITSGSRPLPPQPQIVYTPPLPVPSQEGVPPPPPPPPPPVLPPPPPPPMQYTQVPPPPSIPQSQPYPVNGAPPVPPPPPPSQIHSRRRASLPVPPVTYPSQQHPYQPLPPPLLVPGVEGYPPPPPPPQQLHPELQTFSPGPPPQPPTQFHDHNQWQPGGVGQDYHPVQHVPNYA